ncbi:hypothetical protein XBP1_270050 [Xenorhabdus bovienii str. puntauvense]|uniref:Uncharacterized protein n=1 Tax=Xenorhabdus bovienii str. puntauvense TaxID=1398201 RepID=A0A077NHY7_XENBV|nr:hypothetical protein XBFFR1_1910048 [Xenorhabdus bovienii str. feltiae France]CDG94564.1 hypothetical protein XBFFL1_770048 [Xenorhabdus bovienii str. feltiae Florida]CDG97510.1 hypothetical protein XBP1_270050 [Xenorhabdus bovienii str. puntauvense]
MATLVEKTVCKKKYIRFPLPYYLTITLIYSYIYLFDYEKINILNHIQYVIN